MKLLERCNIVALWVAGFSVLAMSVSGGLDVIFTAALGKPIPMVYELTEALMVLIVFLSLAHLQLTDTHIALELLPPRLGPSSRRFHAMGIQILALVCFAAMTWQAWLMALESWSIREYSVGLYPFPLYPAKFAVVAGGALTTLCCAAKLLQAMTGGAPRPSHAPGAGIGIE